MIKSRIFRNKEMINSVSLGEEMYNSNNYLQIKKVIALLIL